MYVYRSRRRSLVDKDEIEIYGKLCVQLVSVWGSLSSPTIVFNGGTSNAFTPLPRTNDKTQDVVSTGKSVRRKSMTHTIFLSEMVRL